MHPDADALRGLKAENAALRKCLEDIAVVHGVLAVWAKRRDRLRRVVLVRCHPRIRSRARLALLTEASEASHGDA